MEEELRLIKRLIDGCRVTDGERKAINKVLDLVDLAKKLIEERVTLTYQDQLARAIA